ncbi:unnamed protein product, partial [Sphagnum balticum]
LGFLGGLLHFCKCSPFFFCVSDKQLRGVSNNNVWYVDFKASNHMTSHGKWFRDTKDLKTPRFVEIGDDITHPITQI